MALIKYDPAADRFWKPKEKDPYSRSKAVEYHRFKAEKNKTKGTIERLEKDLMREKGLKAEYLIVGAARLRRSSAQKMVTECNHCHDSSRTFTLNGYGYTTAGSKDCICRGQKTLLRGYGIIQDEENPERLQLAIDFFGLPVPM